MNWYGIEPLIEDDLGRYANLAASSAIPRIRINIARRIASSRMSEDGLELLCQALASPAVSHRKDLLTGMLEGLEGRRKVTMPSGWRNAHHRLDTSLDPETREKTSQLALIFNDEAAKRSLVMLAENPKADPAARTGAINALVASKIDDFGESLLRCLDDDSVRESALRGLAVYRPNHAAEQIILRYIDWPNNHKQIALATLASQANWADQLLTAIEGNRIPAQDLTAFIVRQLSAMEDEAISQRLSKLWGKVRKTPQDRARKISKLKSWLTPDVIAKGNDARGEVLFKQQCGKCHRFFGEGGNIGPDLTGAQRTNIDYLLENIVDPSASVSKDHQMEIIQTDDGRVITGLIESENERTLTIVSVDQRISIPLDEIERRKTSSESIMPNELLQNMSDADIRDLFSFLQK